MEIKELLEKAAKACGIDARRLNHTWPDRFDDDLWCPATDDGDCARMEAALGIEFIWNDERSHVVAHSPIKKIDVVFERYGSDKKAARRMASLRVAAAIYDAGVNPNSNQS